MNEAVVGPETGQTLDSFVLYNTSWNDFKSRFPKGNVLIGPNGTTAYDTEPYAGWENRDTPGLFMNPSKSDKRMHQKAVVTGVQVNNTSLCFPHDELKKLTEPLQLEFAGTTLKIEYSSDSDLCRIFDGDTELTPMRAYWFAWFAFFPDTDVWPLDTSEDSE